MFSITIIIWSSLSSIADVQFAVIGPQVGECNAADVVHRFSSGCFPECPESESAEKKDPN